MFVRCHSGCTLSLPREATMISAGTSANKKPRSFGGAFQLKLIRLVPWDLGPAIAPSGLQRSARVRGPFRRARRGRTTPPFLGPHLITGRPEVSPPEPCRYLVRSLHQHEAFA